MKLCIKYMTTPCCKLYVVTELERRGIIINRFIANEVFIEGNLIPEQLTSFKKALLKYGLDLTKDKNENFVEKVKFLIIEKLHSNEGKSKKIVFSIYLHDKLDLNYCHISSAFSLSEGETIEHFSIGHTIEKVKAQLDYNELTISEISNKYNYSSVGHLTYQFKHVTGMTPTIYKKRNNKKD